LTQISGSQINFTTFSGFLHNWYFFSAITTFLTGTSEAVNNGVLPDQIDANNRWRKMHQAGASQPTLTMREHYTDLRLTLSHLLAFSRAL